MFAGVVNTQTPIHQTRLMVNDVLRSGRGDEELAAQRVEFEEQQAHHHGLYQQNLQKFEEASQNLRSELGIEAEQQLNYYAHEEKAYFEAHLLSLRAQAETAVSSAQRNSQQQFINQTLEVQARAEAAEQVAARTAQEHHAQLQQITEFVQDIAQLRRELQEAQHHSEMQTSNCKKNSRKSSSCTTAPRLSQGNGTLLETVSLEHQLHQDGQKDER